MLFSLSYFSDLSSIFWFFFLIFVFLPSASLLLHEPLVVTRYWWIRILFSPVVDAWKVVVCGFSLRSELLLARSICTSTVSSGVLPCILYTPKLFPIFSTIWGPCRSVVYNLISCLLLLCNSARLSDSLYSSCLFFSIACRPFLLIYKTDLLFQHYGFAPFCHSYCTSLLSSFLMILATLPVFSSHLSALIAVCLCCR